VFTGQMWRYRKLRSGLALFLSCSCVVGDPDRGALKAKDYLLEAGMYERESRKAGRF
jgi:hypothetical protein